MGLSQSRSSGPRLGGLYRCPNKKTRFRAFVFFSRADLKLRHAAHCMSVSVPERGKVIRKHVDVMQVNKTEHDNNNGVELGV